MADKQFSVLLEFLTNAAKAEKEVEGLEDAVKGFEGAFPGDKLGKDFLKFQEQLKQTKQTAKQTSAALRAEAAVLSKQAAAIVDGLKARQIGALNEVSSFIGGISRTSLVAGTAIAGGIFAAASNYVKNAKVATEVTDKWNAATASLSRSQDKVGATLAEVSLPLLQKAARLADQASDFVERNPEIVRAALNTGLVLASIGVVGTLVSKGIKLVADVRYLASIPAQITAARLQDAAANKQLAAAQLRAKDLGVKIPGAGGAAAGGAAGLGAAGLIAGGAAAQGALSALLSNSINKLGTSIAGATKNADVGATVITALTTALTPLFPMLPAIQSIKANLPQVTALLEKFGLVAKKTNGLGIADASAGNDLTTAAADHFEQILNAYQDYKRDDLALVQQHYADRQKVIADSVADEQKANQRFSQSVAAQHPSSRRQRSSSPRTIFRRSRNTHSSEPTSFAPAAKIFRESSRTCKRRSGGMNWTIPVASKI
jgi:hypothetical protein